MNFRIVSAFVCALSSALFLSACSFLPGTEPAVKPVPDAELSAAENAVTDEVPVTEEAADEEPAALVHNPLTGEYGYNPDAVGKRPVAVMINNIDQSLPQYGLGSADYIYEALVEGGITRLMAVYADYTKVPVICSVRSCRYYYPLIANGLDAVYCHWGMDMTIAKDTLERLGIDRFDGGDGHEGLFYNDEERLKYYAREHTGCLNGSLLPSFISDAGFRTEAINGGADAMKFAEGTDFTDISEEVCTEAEITYSWAYYSTFTYDSKTKTYTKQHSGEPHMDGATGEQLSFTNVFALLTDLSIRDDGYRMNVGLEGGEGYYFSGGKVRKINWQKDGDDSNFKFTDPVTHQEITVNRGKCYIGLTDSVSY